MEFERVPSACLISWEYLSYISDVGSVKLCKAHTTSFKVQQTGYCNTSNYLTTVSWHFTLCITMVALENV